MAQVDAIHRAAAVDGPPTDGYGQMTSKRLARPRRSPGRRRRRRQGHRRAPTRSSSTPAPTRWCSRPKAVAAMLLFPAWLGFNGKAYAEGTSFAHLGEQQFDERIDLWDDGTDPRVARPALRRRGHPEAPRRPRARRASPSASPTTGAARALAGVGVHRQLDRPGVLRRLPGRPVPRRRRRVARAAHRRRGAGAARHRLLVQPHPRPEDAGRHRPHPQRPVPHRGRRGHRSRCRTSATRSRSSARWPRATCSASATTPQLVSNEGGIVHVPSLRLAAWAFTGNAQG